MLIRSNCACRPADSAAIRLLRCSRLKIRSETDLGQSAIAGTDAGEAKIFPPLPGFELGPRAKRSPNRLTLNAMHLGRHGIFGVDPDIKHGCLYVEKAT